MLPPQRTFTDEYFAIAHDPDTCQPRLHATALGLGLAAGLLCELILDHWIGVTEGTIYPFRYAEVPAESLQHRLYDLIRAEAERWPVDAWLRYLAAEAPDLVGDRLVRSRRYRHATVRTGLLRRNVQRYQPVDPARADYSLVRLRAALRARQPGLDDVVVIAIAAATELAEPLELSDERLPALLGQLPEPVWEVITHTQACVAHHVMTR